MKKITVFIPACIIAIFLVSCGKDDKGMPVISYASDLVNPSLADLDSFYKGGYNTVEGDIVLDSVEGLENLLYLSNLVTLKGNLLIRENAAVTTLEGLHKLRTINGDFVIRGCVHLQQVNYSGFISYIGGSLRIENNGDLSLLELPSLEKVAGDFVLSGNDNLVYHVDVSNLKEVNGSLILANSLLKDMLGFSNIGEIGKNLTLKNNDLRSLAGLEALEWVDGKVEVTGNVKLVDLCALRYLLDRGAVNVSITGNAFNPTVQDIRSGNCSP